MLPVPEEDIYREYMWTRILNSRDNPKLREEVDIGTNLDGLLIESPDMLIENIHNIRDLVDEHKEYLFCSEYSSMFPNKKNYDDAKVLHDKLFASYELITYNVAFQIASDVASEQDVLVDSTLPCGLRDDEKRVLRSYADNIRSAFLKYKGRLANSSKKQIEKAKHDLKKSLLAYQSDVIDDLMQLTFEHSELYHERNRKSPYQLRNGITETLLSDSNLTNTKKRSILPFLLSKYVF